MNTTATAESSPPNAQRSLTYNNDLMSNRVLPPSAITISVSRHPRIQSHVNFSANLYGKITHPVDKILSEIQYTDGLSITKLLALSLIHI